MPHHNIQYLHHSAIDKAKWDQCIQSASNGLIYARSFYLDQMATQWDALVLGNYEAVMPLAWRRKWGISYLYQPFLTPHLGVMGNAITEALVEAFLSAIPATFKYWEINLNPQNSVTPKKPGYSVITKVNYLLSLQPDFTTIETGYRQNHKRNTKKAISLGCTVQKNIPLPDMLALAKQQLDQYTTYTDIDLANFTALCEQLLQRGEAATYGVYLGAQLLSSCIFFFDRKQAYYILAGNHPNSRTIGASHLLFNHFIREEAGKGRVLNFVGSDFKNIAFFYEGFGATMELYPALLLNRLPFFLRWLKK